MEVSLALAILLGTGFIAAKIGQLLRLPSVTGYICAGFIMGPSGFNLITPDVVGHKMDHFNQIALMLIAFGIGEHLEIKRLRYTARNVLSIGICEATGAFSFVFVAIAVGAIAFSMGSAEWTVRDYLILALLLGTVAIATAPASTLHVMREMQASGRWTTTLLQVVAIDNGLAIMSFGIVTSIARHLVGNDGSSLLVGCLLSLGEVAVSLLIGMVTGLLIDFIGSKTKSRSEMLTAGLALLLLCGEGARYFEVSPLLAGMAAGCTIVNRDLRDVRFFRSLNAFETPIYVLFFTLAGAHLDLSAFAVAGFLGGIYFLSRAFGKFVGARLGARLAKADLAIRFFTGQALVSQAGVAIGLIFLIQGDTVLQVYTSVITPVVLAGVFLSEIAGPPLAKQAVFKAGEAESVGDRLAVESAGGRRNGYRVRPERVQLVPWTWEKLVPADIPCGKVLFGASHVATVAGLARMATILAHYHKARPCAVRVLPTEVGRYYKELSADSNLLFAVESAEVQSLGYELDTEIVQDDDVAHGLLAQEQSGKTFGIVLGHPLKGTAKEFQRVVEQVMRGASCPVVVVRFAGILHTEKILVPIVNSDDLTVLADFIRALSVVGRHQITLLRILRSDERKSEIESSRQVLMAWAREVGLASLITIEVIKTEARLETIVEAASHNDLLVMAASWYQGFEKLVFGSLAESVAQECGKPMLIVYEPKSREEEG